MSNFQNVQLHGITFLVSILIIAWSTAKSTSLMEDRHKLMKTLIITLAIRTFICDKSIKGQPKRSESNKFSILSLLLSVLFVLTEHIP